MTSQAIIGAENLLESASSVTASNEAAGYPARNCWDGTTTTYWRIGATGTQSLTAVFAAPVTADYFGLFRASCGTAGASVRLQYSPDSGATWVDCFSALTPADNDCTLKRFTAQTSDYWRVLFSITTAPLDVGVIAFGSALVTYRGMQIGFVPPAASRNTEVLPNTTEGGAFAGLSVIPRGADTTIMFSLVSMAWESTVWRPFVKRAEKKPFFFSWNHAAHPEECVYAWAKAPIPRPAMNEPMLWSITLPIRCLLPGLT